MNASQRLTRELAHRRVMRLAEQLAAKAGPELSADVIEPLWLLQLLGEHQADVERTARLVVSQCRAEGASWADVGKALGMTRQAAHQRYAPQPH